MTQRVLLAIALTGLLLLATLVVEYAFDQRRVLSWFDAKEDAQLILGQQIYDVSCAACHGDNLQGQPNWQSPGPDGLMPAPPHDETGHTWHHPNTLLFDIVKYGVARASNLEDYESAMPAYEGVLSDEEIIAALAYIKSRWPDDLRASHDLLNEQTQR